MKRRDKSFMPALCVSMILHGLGLSALAWWVVKTTPPAKEPPWTRVAVLLATPVQPTKVTPPPVPEAAPPKPPARKKPLEPMKYQKPPDPTHDDSGEHNGVGTANRSTAGQKPMEAAAGLMEQADLMKDAVRFVEDAFLPSSRGKLKENASEKEKAARSGAAAPDPPGAAKAPVIAGAIARSSTPVERLPGHLPQNETAQSSTDNAANASTTNAPAAQMASPKPVRKEILGHKATASDSESIALAKQEHRLFKAGELDGRKGLRTRTTIPHLGDSAYNELRAMARLHLVLGVTVDADGVVQNVDILESSGSLSVDQDFKYEVYNHWNLEPLKDKDGHPVDFNWVITCE